MIVGSVSVELRRRGGHRIAEDAGEERRMATRVGYVGVEYRERILVACDADDVWRVDTNCSFWDLGFRMWRMLWRQP